MQKVIDILRSKTEPWTREILERAISIVAFVLNLKSKEIEDQVKFKSNSMLEESKEKSI